MNIVIMRHGEAEATASSDAQRSLTDYGFEQASKAGQCLKALAFFPDQLWVSPYVRARQTIDGVIRSLYSVDDTADHKADQNTQPELHDTLVPESNPSVVLDSIHTAQCDNLLIVSHQPLVSVLIGLLAGADSRSRVAMAPASMAMLRADVPLAGCCDLQWLRHAPHFDINY